MTRSEMHAVRDAIWLAIVERAELLHDRVVLAQARPTAASAESAHMIADELSVLARTATLLGKERRS